MIRLPIPGQDDGAWGVLLNEFLEVEHANDGSLMLRSDGTLSAKADDSAVVHITGNETIAGVKTFSGSVTVSGTITGSLQRRIIQLTDGTTITPNAATSDIVEVTIAGTRTMDNPAGTPGNGQQLLFKIRQDGVGGHGIIWGGGYRFDNVAEPILNDNAGQLTYVGFIYDATDSKWDCVAAA